MGAYPKRHPVAPARSAPQKIGMYFFPVPTTPTTPSDDCVSLRC